MTASVSGSAPEYVEPLEQEAQNGPTDEVPGEDLLAELGVEFQQTSKPGETPQEATSDATDELEGDKPEGEKDEEVEEPEEKPQEPKGRAQKRIQQLAKDKKELTERLDRQSQEFQKQLEMVASQQVAQSKALARQVAILQRQLAETKGKEPEVDESKLSELERYELGMIRKAEAKLSPKIQKLEQELARRDRAEKMRDQQAKQQANLQQYSEQASAAAKQFLMSDVDDGAFTPEDTSVAGDMVLAFVAATGIEPAKAAQHLKGWLDRYHQGRLQKVSKTSGERIQQSRRVPTPIQQNKTSVQADKKPSWEALKAHGFDNYVQWINQGSPILK